MASKQTYPCFVCQKLGFDIQVYLDGKDEAGNTIRKNVDMTDHYHMTTKKQSQQQQQQQRPKSTTVNVDLLVLETNIKSYFDTIKACSDSINSKLDKAIALLEKEMGTEEAPKAEMKVKAGESIPNHYHRGKVEIVNRILTVVEEHRVNAIKENSPLVQEFRRIENTIILNPVAMKQLRMIQEENDKYTFNGSSFSDVVIFLIREYRKSRLSSSSSND